MIEWPLRRWDQAMGEGSAMIVVVMMYRGLIIYDLRSLLARWFATAIRVSLLSPCVTHNRNSKHVSDTSFTKEKRGRCYKRRKIRHGAHTSRVVWWIFLLVDYWICWVGRVDRGGHSMWFVKRLLYLDVVAA